MLGAMKHFNSRIARTLDTCLACWHGDHGYPALPGLACDCPCHGSQAYQATNQPNPAPQPKDLDYLHCTCEGCRKRVARERLHIHDFPETGSSGPKPAESANLPSATVSCASVVVIQQMKDHPSPFEYAWLARRQGKKFDHVGYWGRTPEEALGWVVRYAYYGAGPIKVEIVPNLVPGQTVSPTPSAGQAPRGRNPRFDP